MMPSVVRRILLAQLGLSLVGGLAIWLLVAQALPSALAGAGIALVTNLVLALRVFVPYRAQETHKLALRFYGAEVLKLLLAMGLFAVVLAWLRPLHPVALFGAFFVIQVVPTLLVQPGRN